MSNKSKTDKVIEQRCVPKLRFPEFRNVGDWEEKILGDISSSISSGKDNKNSIGHYDLYGSTGIIGTTLNGSFDGKFILVARVGANAGLLTKVNGMFGVTDNTLVICIHETVNIEFIFSSLERFGLNKLIFGSGQPLITGRQLKDIPLHLPDGVEQQKIADCLSSLDEIITAQTQKLDTLKAHKKGLMQKLFPTEGETVPEWRFPEFRGKGKWEEKALGKEATIVMGASPKSEFYNEENNGLPLLQGNADIKNRISTPRIFTSKITKACQKGDILISVRAPVGTIAKSKHHACIGRGIAAIRANKNNSQEFIYQLLFAFEPQWENISQGGTFDAVNSDDIRKLKKGFPSKPEQKKIADCLSSLDELITTQTQKIDTLKDHKKGLMQQLFPSVDEVKG